MAKKKRAGAHGGHGWFVTFADLMALLVAFFVMLSATSTQDLAKAKAIAGSMRDAFGTQNAVRYSGMIEAEGLPTRPKLKNAAHIPPEEATDSPSPNVNDRNRGEEARLKQERTFALAASTLRQALQDMPDLTEVSKHVMIEESKEGLNVEIIDQDGRSMFPEGSAEAYERTRRLIKKLAGPLRSTQFRIAISGHTSVPKAQLKPGQGAWDLSSNRANAVRLILEEEGVPSGNFFAVTGKADIQPLFPDDISIAANRRVTITLMREEPPLPVNFKP
jgi:chemotaxis protein MotB